LGGWRKGMTNGEATVILVAMMANMLAIVLAIALYASRYKRVPPGHAMIIYGRRTRSGGETFRVLTGGGRFIVPIIESYEFLSLEPFDIDEVIDGVVEDVRDPAGARLLRVQLLATTCLSDDPEGVRMAARNFLHHTRDELRRIVARTLEGHARGLLGAGGLAGDRQLSELVQEAAEADLGKVGIRVVTASVIRLGPSDGAAGLLATIEAIQRKLSALEARLGRVEQRLPQPENRKGARSRTGQPTRR